MGSQVRKAAICGTELRTDCAFWNADGLCGGGWTRGLSGAARCDAREFAVALFTPDRRSLFAAQARAERLALTRRWARTCGPEDRSSRRAPNGQPLANTSLPFASAIARVFIGFEITTRATRATISFASRACCTSPRSRPHRTAVSCRRGSEALPASSRPARLGAPVSRCAVHGDGADVFLLRALQDACPPHGGMRAFS
jgi:hypothetical protein